MNYRRLDENGDYCFGHNQQDFVFDTDAVAQAIETKLKFFQGEWWEDVTAGIPMFQQILGRPATQQTKDAADVLIKDQIASTPGVQSVSNLVSEFISRQYNFQAQVQTIFGPVELEVML